MEIRPVSAKRRNQNLISTRRIASKSVETMSYNILQAIRKTNKTKRSVLRARHTQLFRNAYQRSIDFDRWFVILYYIVVVFYNFKTAFRVLMNEYYNTVYTRSYTRLRRVRESYLYARPCGIKYIFYIYIYICMLFVRVAFTSL